MIYKKLKINKMIFKIKVNKVVMTVILLILSLINI